MKSEQLSQAISQIDTSFVDKTARLRNKKKNRNLLYKSIAIAACFCMIFVVVVFALDDDTAPVGVKAENLMEGVIANDVEISSLKYNEQFTDFAVRLLQSCEKTGENTLVSPLSVLCALSMTANGADGDTLKQMEDVFGMSIDELNNYLYSYINTRPQDEKYRFCLANGIWFNETYDFAVGTDFIQKNADYYSAELRRNIFDEETRNNINSWVSDRSGGLIPEMLDKNNFDPAAIMYIINALAFEAEWEEIYAKEETYDLDFTLENGQEKLVHYMNATENIYLYSDDAKGFIKPYKDGKYAFAAILPNEGITISDYVKSLSGEKLYNMLSSAVNTEVFTSTPQFETSFDIELKEPLMNMGMTIPFDRFDADFSKMIPEQIESVFISKVLHKTSISMTYRGTKAGAATSVEVYFGGWGEKIEAVLLHRPFIYMIIDCETNTPFFIGTMMNPTPLTTS